MNGIEDELRSKYRANPIPTRIGTRQIHRITDVDADLTELDELRRKSLLRVILERLFFVGVFQVGVICLSVLLQFAVLLWAVLIVLAVCLAYYAVGLLAVCNR